MRRIVVGAALLAMSACGAKYVTRDDRIAASKELAKRPAGTQVTNRELALADQDKTVVCENRMVVGSHIPTRRCRTLRQIEEEKQATQNRSPGGCLQGGDRTGSANVGRVPCVDGT
ncbi:MAG TPA: hypothetical protein VIG99_08390 [Myxococcaceae bacterium]|jgi:hypothetical protein